ncbi:acetyl-CoA carboxylase biotin carboxyl carrier protein [Thermocatellispora tengchongensis]|uniref:Biotin carboxyl carrier protein of acetyl-CoA carboxylase n=1 Tax=Thermocatellispora tengchongensis TaxID=1073253 RepID=A0A840PCS2_9ACTN|nr:biotin/lipoyl-containing protein [Thermocatellispora tengchongensis]MBB5139214.1 acetyl-CoA carboxylase biotin carboxyl carrier protein [Thermocatellispora tengchongensis]
MTIASENAERVLLALRDNAVALATQTPRPPTWIRVASGDAAVELSWSPEAGNGAGAGYDGDSSGAGHAGDSSGAGHAGDASGGVRGGDGASDAAGGAGVVSDVGDGDVGGPDGGDAAVAHIGAPTVGVFYRAPEPGAEPFVAVGDTVAAGQQVGIVEAMKLMIPVQAERAGRVVEVLVEDATQVEYGEPLIAYVPVGGP